MPPKTLRRTGAQVLVDQLVLHGADTAFGVPGESYLAVLDALYDVADRLRFVVCRHEAGAANMAEAYGKLTARPGIAMVTRGPGACHAAIGVHNARQDSTPMILLIGQVARPFRGREAFQEIDYASFFADQAKWVVEIDQAARIPELIARAFSVATSGRPGPVVVSLPEDMLTDQVETADAGPIPRAEAHPDPAAMSALAALLAEAARPVLLVGGGGWDASCSAAVSGFAERCGLPAVTAFRRQDCIDNDHPAYAGHLGVGADLPLERFIADSDLILAIGPRLGEATTGGYARIRAPVPSQKLVHVHPCAEELGSVYRPTLPILASLPAFCARLGGLKIAVRPEWGPRARQMRESYLETSRPVASPGNVNLAEIYASLRGLIGPDAIVTNGAGNYAAWMHRFLRNNRFGTHLGPTSGAMGYGVPAAIAAKIVHPERTVVSVNGDGCFMMCAQELATAMRYRLDPIILVVNNAMYGTIRAHQERAYPGRVSGTDLTNPDFVAFARSFGLAAERVERTEDFAGAFARARGAGTAALIELVVDPEALTPSASLTEIRERARAAAEAAD